MVTNESFDGQPICLVVLLMEPICLCTVQRQMFDKVLIDQLGHLIMDLLA